MLCATSTGLGNIVGAIRRSSAAPDVKIHHSRKIATIGMAPRTIAAQRGTWLRIVTKDWKRIRQTLRKGFGPVNRVVANRNFSSTLAENEKSLSQVCSRGLYARVQA